MPDTLERALLPFFSPSSEDLYSEELTELVEKWAAGDSAAISEVEKLMAFAKLKMETVVDRALVNKLEQIEHIDRLIANGENHRNATLREIDRHRPVFAESLRAKIRDIDAGFETVKTKVIAVKNATNATMRPTRHEQH